MNTIIKTGAEEILVRYEDPQDGLHGTHCWDEDLGYVITVHHRQGSHAAAMTLLHEVLHNIDDRYGLDLEEQGVATLEQALADLIDRNPVIMTTLVETLASRPPTQEP